MNADDYNIDWVLYAIAIALGCFLILITARAIAIWALNRAADHIERLCIQAIEGVNTQREHDKIDDEWRQLASHHDD